MTAKRWPLCQTRAKHTIWPLLSVRKNEGLTQRHDLQLMKHVKALPARDRCRPS